MVTFKRLGHYGRFGNQLFQIAATIGIADSLKRTFSFPRWENHDHARFNKGASKSVTHIFKNPLPVTSDHYLSPMREIEVPFGYHPNITFPKYPFSLYGFFQSEKYFINSIDRVAYYFEFSNPDAHKINRALNKNHCSIHFRRGDYSSSVYVLLGHDYYQKAINMMARNYGLKKFMVFSDDIPEAKRLFSSYGFLEGCEPGIEIDYYDYGVDDYLNEFRFMSCFGGYIIANSSFSWWAAYLSGSEAVIAPKDWFNPKSLMDGSDIIPDRWMSL